jgi:hypothetical protein
VTGRPSDYSDELAAEICGKLASGKPLTKICAEESMPCESTVYLWLKKQEGFSEMYARAREDQADTLADEMLEIADDSSRDTLKTEAGEVCNTEYVQRSRLRVDTRKWIASKLKPRKYGDKVEHTGPAGGAFQHVHRIELVALAK